MIPIEPGFHCNKTNKKVKPMSQIEDKLNALGIELPTPTAPLAAYVATRLVGDLLYISGQLPMTGDTLINGHLGGDVPNEIGQDAARICAVNIFAQAKLALGDLDRLLECISLRIYVASTPDFTEHHIIANGASNLIVEIMGEAGKHTRAAFGVAALPLNAAVEIEAILQVKI